MFKHLLFFLIAASLLVLPAYPARAGLDACTDGESRICGSAYGVCETGMSTCIKGEWTECVGEKGPDSDIDICGNGLDDNCNGLTDEGCDGYEVRCHNRKQDWGEEGVDCGGSCPESCTDFPWTWFILIGLGLFMLAMILYYRQRSGEVIQSESIGKD